MNRVLLTGGLGYVGGRLVNYLLANSNADIFVSSRRQVDVATIFGNRRVKLYSADILKDASMRLPEAIDAIIHLAATNELDAADDPANSILVNVHESYILLEKAIKQNVKRFVYFSTAHVYGSPLQGLITEELCPKPIHPYAITHKGFEDFLWAANHKKEIEGVIIRLSNSFGAPFFPDVNRWSLLVNDLCRQAVTSKQMTLKSSGIQVRDFVTLTDVCKAVQHLLAIPSQSLYDGVFNLGGNHVISVFDMAALIQKRLNEQFNQSVSIIKSDSTSDEQPILPLQFSSIRLESTGFVREGDVEDELDQLIKFCIHHFS